MKSTTFILLQKLIESGFTATFNSSFRYAFNRYYDIAECNIAYSGNIKSAELHRLHKVISTMPFPCEIKLGRGNGDIVYMHITPVAVEYIEQEGISYPFIDDSNYSKPTATILTHEQFINMHNKIS